MDNKQADSIFANLDVDTAHRIIYEDGCSDLECEICYTCPCCGEIH